MSTPKTNMADASDGSNASHTGASSISRKQQPPVPPTEAAGGIRSPRPASARWATKPAAGNSPAASAASQPPSSVLPSQQMSENAGGSQQHAQPHAPLLQQVVVNKAGLRAAVQYHAAPSIT